MSEESPTQFSFGIRLALVFITQSAFLSAIAVTLLLSYVAYNAIHNYRNPSPIGSSSWSFLRSPVDWYFLFLLISDLIQAIGAILDIEWVHLARLEAGPLCTAQGILKQLGDVGVALGTLAIACHTFAILFLRWNAPTSRALPIAVISTFCLFLTLIILICHFKNTDPPFYGPSTYWCWIDQKYTGEKMGLEYGIMWFVAVVNIVLYVPLFFFLRGNITVSFDHVVPGSAGSAGRPKLYWKSVKKDKTWARRSRDSHAARIAKQMLAYPIIYVIVILPQSIIRWIDMIHHKPASSEWTAIAGVIFGSSGLVNVLLYMITRPSLIPRFHRRSGSETMSGEKGRGGRANTMPEVTVMSFHSANQPMGDRDKDLEMAMTPSSMADGTLHTMRPSDSSSPGVGRPVPMLTDADDSDSDDGFPRIHVDDSGVRDTNQYLSAPVDSPGMRGSSALEEHQQQQYTNWISSPQSNPSEFYFNGQSPASSADASHRIP